MALRGETPRYNSLQACEYEFHILISIYLKDQENTLNIVVDFDYDPLINRGSKLS